MNCDGEEYLIVLDYKLVQWWLALCGSPSSFGLLGRRAPRYVNEEIRMAGREPLPRYHIGEQDAAVLLRPVVQELAVLETRLAHYAERILMSDADRVVIREAQNVLSRTLADVTRIAAASEAEK
ncbi:MAG TPA: hypothetical protein VNG11_04415 [Chloroflexota bacterium]|nr:hypothetical protein [Chloroflexota bacterium]